MQSCSLPPNIASFRASAKDVVRKADAQKRACFAVMEEGEQEGGRDHRKELAQRARSLWEVHLQIRSSANTQHLYVF